MSSITIKQPIQLEQSWLGVLEGEFEQPYMRELKSFLREEKSRRKIIYPASDNWFNAFNSTPFDQVKVVILGQDPYHGPDQAHGLCFSVLPGVKCPPSLVNIYKEIEQDLGITQPVYGNLQSWADQGVLLLNSTLTVEAHRAGSHQGKGWEQFTDRAIQVLDQQRENLVFLLWGSYAQKKGQFINQNKHQVLKSVHPSPLSAHRGFFGNRHFSRTNHWLEKNGLLPIEWAVSANK